VSWAEPGEGEPWLSREEIVAREFEEKQRDYEDWPRRLDKLCREAEARWRAIHPWLAPGWCVSVPVRRLGLPCG
jgi:hypothetical protein